MTVPNVSYLRRPVSEGASARRRGRISVHYRRPRRGVFTAVGLLALAAAAAVVAIALATSHASLKADGRALARVDLPLGGGKIESVLATSGPTASLLPVELRGRQIWPRRRIPAGQAVTIQVVVKRPGAISWLTGSEERLRLTIIAPTAHVLSPYLTLAAGAPLRVRFNQPVQWVTYGPLGSIKRHVLPAPETTVALPRPAAAGSELVAAGPRTWESARASTVSWFPAGARRATAVASPSPGSRITPETPITLTFSEPVAKALGSNLPPVSPGTPGSWHEGNVHTITFDPQGYGYGLGTTVKVPLPSGVNVVGAGGPVASWSVPPGSTLRLQQLLAQLGYLPVDFNGPHVGLTPQAQIQAAVRPPSGTFGWRYPNTPSVLRSDWQPGTFGTITRGAVMAFENNQGMTADGVAGPQVWKALIAAAIAGKSSTFGYTVVSVSEGSPESQSTWHNGRVVVSGPVNTGIPQAPTALGLYPVFEHAPSVTMSGTNPDGSHYSDPGVPWVSYFNGGDALHGFLRASYGTAQSLGCVEMPYSEAEAVYNYTPIGTLVNVT
jgi:lipoprotein-anchoring transpeptidase ErfK/SrfK